jgi:aminoglycoside phosphotransferase (APT) family kinase protein
MSEERTRELEHSLATILPGNPEVRVTGAASVGAQRNTLFIDILESGSVRKAVAQIATGPLAVSDIDLEATLIRDAHRAGMAVPEVLAWDAEAGTVITEHVAGDSIPRKILRRVEAKPELGPKLARDCGSALARLHGLPVDAYPTLPDLRAPERYVEELTATLEGLTSPHPTFRLGLNWLARNARAFERDARGSLVHGDFRNGNLLVSDHGLSAVLDWELVHRGDAMEDLAWLCLRTWRFGNDAAQVGGFAKRADLEAGYAAAGGSWREDAFRWWTVARTLWWGLGLARQAQAFLEGHSTSIVLAASGRRVVELEYDLLTSIAEPLIPSSR